MLVYIMLTGNSFSLFPLCTIDYDQSQTIRQLQLDGNKLLVDKLWQHPIESSLRVTKLSPRITKEILEGYFEAQGDVTVKTVVLSPNGEFATVELTNTLSEQLSE